MIIFEDQLARLVQVLPAVTVGAVTRTINYGWGTEAVLMKYLALKGKLSFPLIWTVEAEDTNNDREPSVTRNATVIILHESQAPDEFNDYQHKFDYSVILQPICDNLLTAFIQSGISRFDDTDYKTKRIKNYSLREDEQSSLIYICNAIVLTANITFSGVSSCLKNINF